MVAFSLIRIVQIVFFLIYCILIQASSNKSCSYFNFPTKQRNEEWLKNFAQYYNCKLEINDWV